MYGYVWNDPINWVDPEGTFAIALPFFAFPGAGAAIGGAAAAAAGAAVGWFWGPDTDGGGSDWSAPMCSTPYGDAKGGHRNNQNPANLPKHERGEANRKRSRGGEKGDSSRRPPRVPPAGHKGPWPPKK